MAVRWHILKSTERFGAAAVQAVWARERAANVITAGYGNEPEGKGRAVLTRFRPGDVVLAYAPGFGAVGVGEVVGAEPYHRPTPSPRQHAHHRAVRWRATVDALSDAVPPAAIRAAGGYCPRTLAMTLSEPAASTVVHLVEAAAAR